MKKQDKPKPIDTKNTPNQRKKPQPKQLVCNLWTYGKKTVQTLENLREKLHAQNLDETIQLLIKKQRKTALNKGFGVAKNHLKSYTKADRGEDRN